MVVLCSDKTGTLTLNQMAIQVSCCLCRIVFCLGRDDKL